MELELVAVLRNDAAGLVQLTLKPIGPKIAESANPHKKQIADTDDR